MSLPLQVARTLSLSLLLTLASFATAQESLQAQIGIEVKSGKRMTWARANERVHAGDFLRIHVMPAEPSYIYVVYTDGKDVTLLNSQGSQTQRHQGDVLILPSQDQFYQISAGSTEEHITVICSREKIQEIPDMSAHELSPQQWSALEEKLMKKSEIDLSSAIEKPMPTAGNTRGMKSYTGKSLLVKKYAFQVAQ